ncbi:T9SS type A sorting domain-containing protein [bacterium]|nr:T9SS type A sorting domain-containing protein [bacterium]
MPKSFIVIVGLILISSLGFSETVVSIVGTSVDNGTPLAAVPINLINTDAVGGLQFSVKDVPNHLAFAGVYAAGRTAAEPFDDFGVDGIEGTSDFGEGDGLYTPGEPFTDVNGNSEWDGAFSIEFNDRDTTVSVLIFDASGNSIIPGNGPICTILFSIPGTVSDEITDLRFNDVIEDDYEFLLGVTDPDGNPVNTIWTNGFLTVGGIEVTIASGGGGTANNFSVPIGIEMDNAVPVKGIQFNLVDAPDYLTVYSVQGVGRGVDFTFAFNEVAGQSMVLGVSFAGDEIAAGSGAFVELVFTIDADAPLGEFPIAISQLIVAAAGGVPLPSNGGDGMFAVTTGVDDRAEVPTKYELTQNFPNPFNPTTTIEYSVPEASDVHVGIFNLLGQEVRTLATGEHQPGFYSALWNGLDNNGIRVESGVYLYRMNSKAGFSATKKLVMLK